MEENRPRLELIFGPMYSGKTTELCRRLNIYADVNPKIRIFYINHVFDIRAVTPFSTHGYISRLNPTINCAKLQKLSDSDYMQYDVIGIDEAQFFPDLYEMVMTAVEKAKKTVIVSSLDSDFRRQHFGQVMKLVQHADKLDKLSAYCMSCSHHTSNSTAMIPAIYSLKIDDTTKFIHLTDDPAQPVRPIEQIEEKKIDVVEKTDIVKKVEKQEGDIISIGGKEKYNAVCRECYLTWDLINKQ